ncbi:MULTISPECIES: hypothetical protein [unclassified Streptomyces]|uniref:hypothetical protein n=1 Tax=unclassified Streptomyces TaxID=2593676 RepID=UPI000FF0D6AA|nr:hypothetical protein [Streptomyces sp. LaPpAH-202]MYW58941.1 hypothetical protein [Streptomyces sp. SID8370]MYW88130.1 hypothetical protein [Streptomyces sp. SID8371]
MPASWAADPGESELAISATSDHLAKIERAVSRTRASHAGQPSEMVHLLLSEALRDEGAERSVAQQGPHGVTTKPCQHPVTVLIRLCGNPAPAEMFRLPTFG